MSSDFMCVSVDRGRIQCLENELNEMLNAKPQINGFVIQLSKTHMVITPKYDPVEIVLNEQERRDE